MLFLLTFKHDIPISVALIDQDLDQLQTSGLMQENFVSASNVPNEFVTAQIDQLGDVNLTNFEASMGLSQFSNSTCRN
jgi:hypothetical protein